MCRGIKNNNPGNIRKSKIKYLGETDLSSDKEFKQFDAPEWGYRALFVLLHTYNIKHGLNTIEKILKRYAPPTENDTERYISFVAYRANIKKNEPIDTLSESTMKPVAAAISRMENGVEASENDINNGWKLFIKYPV